MNKKFVVINTIITFLVSFLVHYIYQWIPSFITTIFPVNESLYEHMKLIFISPIISGLLIYFYFRKKNYVINNFLFGLICSIIFNIIIFYLAYLPLYYEFGQSMLMTLSVYFVAIALSNYLYYLIIEMNNNKKLNRISLIMLIVISFILIYFTYKPLRIDFFKDPINNTYGIPK